MWAVAGKCNKILCIPPQPIQPTTQTNNTWRLPSWLRASCGRHMRAVRLCHTTSQWRGTATELHGCCIRTSTTLLLVRQHIDRVARGLGQQRRYQERVARALLRSVHHHVGARLEMRKVGGPATARRQSVRGNRRRRYSNSVGCLRHSNSVGDLPASNVSALQLVLQTMCSAPTPPEPQPPCASGGGWRRRLAWIAWHLRRVPKVGRQWVG